jgi:hypothetical protein
MTRTTLAITLALLSMICAARSAHAGQAEGVIGASTTPAPNATPEIVPPYSLPWQLRPVTAGNVVRVDSAVAAFNDANGNLDVAVTTTLAASYQLTRDWAPMLRLGFVGNDAPGAALDGSSLVNPIVGATYTRRMGSFGLALHGATTLPVGTGGGNAPNVGAAKTNAASVVARPADEAMFAVNYVTAIVGAGFAYVNHGLTAQAEATLQQAVRVRGAESAGGADAFRTTAAVGLHLGGFIGSHFSLGADLRYQRWLVSAPDASSDVVTVAVGPRVNARLGKQVWLRPGLAFVRAVDRRGLDAPLITGQTTAVLLDVPVTF